MQPSETMYQYLMLHMCSQGLDAAMNLIPALEVS